MSVHSLRFWFLEIGGGTLLGGSLLLCFVRWGFLFLGLALEYSSVGRVSVGVVDVVGVVVGSSVVSVFSVYGKTQASGV